MEDFTSGFLAERLAKAQAVPAGERSADVRAFIETCALQAELVQALGLTEAVDTRTRLVAMLQWTAAPALKLVRSHYISLGWAALMHSPQLQRFAVENLYLRSSFQYTRTLPPDLGHELAELVEREPSLRTLAVLAAGLPGVPFNRGWERGLLKLSNRVVALMQRPAVRRRLQAELAALPHQLVSYEELLALYIDFGRKQATHLLCTRGAGAASVDLRTAARLAVELLPQLAPSYPRALYAAASMESFNYGVVTFNSDDPAAAGRSRYRSMLLAALDVARQQGSDYYVACCGYQLATEDWGVESAEEQEEPPPSAVLAWLLGAEAAHRRCKALLPKQWTGQLDGLMAAAAPIKTWLQRLVQQGDRWLGLTAAEAEEQNAALQECSRAENDTDARKEQLICGGCDKLAPQLRLCRACREVQYCSVECQRAHWREHKARCKEVQAAKAASGGASTSGGGS